MSVTLDRFNDCLAVRLTTRHADAWLIPGSPIRATDENLAYALHQRRSRWAAQGYAQEDAATLALCELSVAGAQLHSQGTAIDRTALAQTLVPLHALADPKHFPQLVDAALAPAVQSQRLNAPPFATLKDAHPGVYPIVDQLPMLEQLLAAGARIIQLRIKSDHLTPEIERDIIRAIRISEQFPHAQLFVNDYWPCAIANGAYGVHLGQEDLLTADLAAIGNAGVRLGVSSHAYWEVARALTIKPSYVACGPIFPTRAKVMPWIAQGISNLAYWTRLIPHPVVAIGGIHAGRLAAVCATGCASASVIQAIAAAPDPAAAYRELQHAWELATSERVFDSKGSGPHAADDSKRGLALEVIAAPTLADTPA